MVKASSEGLIRGAEGLPVDVRDLYPFQSHFHREPAMGLALHYLDEGSGQPILMVHGNPNWSFYFRDLVRAFWKSHRVIAPDHIGCGLSDKPQKYPYTLAQHIRNLESLVLAQDLQDITLVVHDWGGPIGLGVAGRHPERFKRLVIMNTAAFASERMPFLLHLARVPVVGSSTLAGLVHRGCLQIAIDRDLLVTSVTARPFPGMATLALDIGLFNPSPRVWTGLHVAASAQPVVVNNGLQVALEPGTSGDLRAQFWPDDCADPVGALRDGIAVEADLGPTGQTPSLATTTSVLLRLPGQMLDDVAKAAVAMCGTTPPRGTVEWARLREGGGNGSGGVASAI